MSNITETRTGTDLQKSKHLHMLNPFEEMERLFEGFSNKGWLRPFHWESPLLSDIELPLERKIPTIDVLENDDKITIKAEMPGVEKKNLDISVTNNSVTIKGTTSQEDKKEEGDYYRCEISKGSYMRTLALPTEVDEEKTTAKFKDGVLELVLPKLEKSHRRSIKVD